MFESIPDSLPPPWWFLGAMLFVFALTVRWIFRMQDQNNATFRQSMDKLIQHFVEDGKQKIKMFERSLKSVLSTTSDGFANVADQLKDLTDGVGGLSSAIKGHTGLINEIHEEVKRLRDSDPRIPKSD